MKEMLVRGTTLLYVSHSISSVQEICDNALWLEKGQEVMSGNVYTVTDGYLSKYDTE